MDVHIEGYDEERAWLGRPPRDPEATIGFIEWLATWMEHAERAQGAVPGAAPAQVAAVMAMFILTL